MTALRITDQSTRAEIETGIARLRAKAQRYSLHDPRRLACDEEVDQLVAQWIEAEA